MTSYIHLLHVLLLLLLLQCSAVNLQVKSDVKLRSFVPKNGNFTVNSNELKGGAKTVLHSVSVTQVGSEKPHVKTSRKDVMNDIIDKKNQVVINDIDRENLGVLNDIDKKNRVVSNDTDKKNQAVFADIDGTNRVVSNDVDKRNEVVYDGAEKRNEFVREGIDVRNASVSLQSKGGHNQDISEGSSNGKLKGKGKDPSVKSGSVEQLAKDGNEESSISLAGIEKERLRDEECDPSNMCIDEKKNLTACIRVPGNDSPDLSLLIQNKGSRPVTITIIAPPFVQLEETKVVLQQNEDKKVTVTLAYEGMDSLIFLTTEDSRCTLDFRDLIPGDSRTEAHYGFKLRYLNNLTRTHWLMFLSISTLLVFGSAWVILNLRKRFFAGNEYQVVDMELTVSGASKTSSEQNDHWDSGWEDNWDDEEAPKTPTLPSTPNLSSRGLSSRRLIKESWKG